MPPANEEQGLVREMATTTQEWGVVGPMATANQA